MIALPEEMATSQILELGNDRALRNKYFVPASYGHPAKLHLGLVNWLVARYTQPGDTIVDPMTGIGSTMVATLLQRNVVAQDVELPWLSLCHENAAKIIQEAGLFAGAITVSQHDARQPWPTKADHLLFSPPYGCQFSGNPAAKKRILDKRLSNGAITGDKTKYSARWRQLAERETTQPGSAGSLIFAYGTSPDQIGHWRGKRYWLAMRQIYTNALAALKPNGYMILVIKDHISDGVQVETSNQTIALCEELGFRLVAHHYRKLGQLSLWQRRRREAGKPVIEFEDVLVFKRQEAR